MTRSALVLVLVACRIDSIDLTGKPCPCPSDWTCNPATNTCTRESIEPDAMQNEAPQDSAFDLVSGLAFHFRFEATSGQTVTDSAPLARHGHAYNEAEIMWTTGRVGRGLHFTGRDYASFVIFPSTDGTCGTPQPVTGSFTTSMWVRFDSFHPYNSYTLGDIAAMHGSAGGNEGGWGIGASDACNPGTHSASVTITPPDNGIRIKRCGSTALSPNTWYYLTGVYDATARSLDIYVNGVRDNGALLPDGVAIPATIQAAPGCPYLAASSNQSNLLYGTLDEFRFYTRAFTAAEVAELHRISN